MVADRVPERFRELTALFWPGPLTLVVPASARVPVEVTGGRGTVAVRVPGLALPRRLAAALGRPVTGTSANLHGQPPCRTALEVAAAFGDQLDLVLDGGPTAAGKPSTILDLTGDEPRILREGLLPASSLQPYLPELESP
jgi:tRNA threonylcarbamoyl adenosine modification protein (Sua5/YciO/YrdC/YwlC family)